MRHGCFIPSGPITLVTQSTHVDYMMFSRNAGSQLVWAVEAGGAQVAADGGADGARARNFQTKVRPDTV